MAIQRINIDTRGNNILSLFTENKADLGFDAALNKLNNRYSSVDNRTYSEQFGNTIAGDAYYPPSSTDINNSVTKAFNLGQIIGPDQGEIARLIEGGQDLGRQFFQNLANDAVLANNPFLAAWWNMMSGIVIGPVNRVSQLYRPGFSRPSIPGNRGRLSQIPLSESLEQNLLLPPGDGSLPLASTHSMDETLESTFDELYINNRSNRASEPRYSNGLIAGTGVNDLQEPVRDMAGNAVGADTGRVSTPFSFEEDDKQYLTYSHKVQGFIGNTPSTLQNPNAQDVAVRDYKRAGSFKQDASQFVNYTNKQYFPFSFATVNKKNNRVQLCSLQATIQSLGESYAPTWQSKHFFGRSEQLHTYTFTDRTIDVSFVVAADSMRKLQNVYERISWLAQQCYPDYSSNDRIGSGPIIAMSIGDLFQYKAGFIRSLSYDWSYLGGGAGKWELTRGVRMPQACNVTMSYQVIHEKVPDRDYDFYGGPAGGVSEGMKNHRTIDYGTAPSGGGDADVVSDTNRYITGGVLEGEGVNGERDYLRYVSEVNQPDFVSGATPNDDDDTDGS